MPTITIKDEALYGATQPSWQLDITKVQSTLRDIIRCRIFQDVSIYNDQRHKQSSDFISSTLLGQRLADPTTLLDLQAHYEQAIAAFEKGSYLVIIDDQQVTYLDTVICVTPTSTVTFFKMIPLIGG